MGGCFGKEKQKPKDDVAHYVTESSEDNQQPNDGSESSESSESSWDDVDFIQKTREDTLLAFQRNRELDPESLNIYEMPVKETDKCQHAIDEDGYRWVNEYVMLKTLGKGSYGKVKLCLNYNTGQSCAVKICNKIVLGKKRKGGFNAGTFLEDVRKEIAILKHIDHPNCVKLFEVIDDPKDDKLYMIFEFVRHGTLMKGVVEQEPLDMAAAWRYFRDILAGLEYLHHMRVIHRDIKPENLLRSENEIKIGDFGVSHVFPEGDDTLRRTEGSPAFLAPEILSGGEFSGKAIDLWALGVTLYVFIFGTCPFMAESEFAIYEKIRESEPEYPHAIDPRLRELLEGMLRKDPKERLTLAQIKEHPWVTMNGAFPMPEANYPPPQFTAEDVMQFSKSPSRENLLGASLSMTNPNPP